MKSVNLSLLLRLLGPIVVAATLAAPGTALAAKVKPYYTLKSKAFVGSVTIDPKLNAYRDLFGFLTAEGYRNLNQQRKDADDARRQDPKAFGNSPWTFEREYALRSVVDRFISVVRTDVSYSGGAHPNTDIATVIWDRRGERGAMLNDFFVNVKEDGATLKRLAALIRESLAAVKKKRGIEVAANPAKDEWLKSVDAKLDTLGAPSLAPSTVSGKTSGFTFHFSPYAVGPYAEGPYVAFVPCAALMSLLKDDIKPLCAGERPAADAAE